MLENVKGYGPLVKERQATLAALFEGTRDSERRGALEAIRRIRPAVADLIQYPSDNGLETWLAAEPDVTCIHRDAGYAVWLVHASRPLS